MPMIRGRAWKLAFILGVIVLAIGLRVWSAYSSPHYEVSKVMSQRIDDITVHVVATVTNDGHSAGSPSCQAEVGALPGPYDSDDTITVPRLNPNQSYHIDRTVVLKKVDVKDTARIVCADYGY